jgi:hypothetical protein
VSGATTSKGRSTLKERCCYGKKTISITDKKKMTKAERNKRTEDAFNWKESDIEILTPGDPAGDEPSFEDVVPEEQPKTR